MQFLMGLDDIFDHSKDHILLMDPLSLVNKIYSVILKVEKQRLNRIVHTRNLEMTTLLTKSHPYSHRVDYNSKSIPPFNSRNEAFQTLSTIKTLTA